MIQVSFILDENYTNTVSTRGLFTHNATIDITENTTYSQTENYFNAIKTSDILIVANNRHSSNAGILKYLAYAMVLGKPIILFEPPVFKKITDRFLYEMLDRRLSKLIICNLDMLDDQDARQVVVELKDSKINYVMTKHQVVLINSKIKALFRQLLTA